MFLTREDSLLPIISDNANFFGSGLSQINELSSGFGIADIVFYSLYSTDVNKRIKEKLYPIDSYEIIRVLMALNTIEKR